MTQNATLDISGDLRRNPLSELLVEISHADLSGSLRLSNGSRKTIVYVRKGRIQHAVSNLREHRLFSIALDRKLLQKETLAGHSNFTNDIEFSASLLRSGTLTKSVLAELSTTQIETILIDTLSWTEGDWLYSPHARLRADLDYQIDSQKLLMDLARCLPANHIVERFRSVEEVFCRSVRPEPLDLQAHERLVLDLIAAGQFSISQLRQMSSLPEGGLLQALYTLWMGGALLRRDWTSALTASKLDSIRSARFAKVSEATMLPASERTAPPESQFPDARPPSEEPEPAAKTFEIDISVRDYLEQVETSESYYALLGLNHEASSADIKSRYLAYAKSFHPDRYYREDAETHRRVQNAFTRLALAYENLKTPEAREAYDYKLSKELEIQEKRKANAAQNPGAEIPEAERGLESFELGLEQFQDEEYAAAATHLARAVHYSPQNALYHAYFGKALSYTGEKYRHKAEGEMQQAAKLDPTNAKIRMMLIEFFIEMNLQKRAEGELRRFLDLVPGNKEALAMMDRLQAMAA